MNGVFQKLALRKQWKRTLVGTTCNCFIDFVWSKSKSKAIKRGWYRNTRNTFFRLGVARLSRSQGTYQERRCLIGKRVLRQAEMRLTTYPRFSLTARTFIVSTYKAEVKQNLKQRLKLFSALRLHHIFYYFDMLVLQPILRHWSPKSIHHIKLLNQGRKPTRNIHTLSIFCLS